MCGGDDYLESENEKLFQNRFEASVLPIFQNYIGHIEDITCEKEIINEGRINLFSNEIKKILIKEYLR